MHLTDYQTFPQSAVVNVPDSAVGIRGGSRDKQTESECLRCGIQAGRPGGSSTEETGVETESQTTPGELMELQSTFSLWL